MESSQIAAGTWTLQERDELGAGGYGKVVKASHADGRVAAAKLISTSRMKRTAIEKEIGFMAKLKHPNIIEFFGWEQLAEQNRMIIYMELAGCGELFSRVINAGCLEEPLARRYFVQILNAVLHMHNVGVVHRDLKLENVLLDAADNCKVCDFGLAHQYERSVDKELQLTKLREICGSKSYCAPEVLQGHGYDGFPTDVWSCGICLFAMLAGFFPLDEASGADWRYERVKLAAAAGQSTTCTIFGFYDRPCTLSPEVTSLIDGMLSVQPAQRMQVAHALGSPWALGQVEEAPTYRSGAEAPNYRSAAKHLDASALEAMYSAEGAGRPVYRGRDHLQPGAAPPMLQKQKAMFCADFHLPEGE